MPQKISYLLTLILAVGSALVTLPSQAQTANSKKEVTGFSQSSITNDVPKTSKLSDSSSLNKDNNTTISQSQPEESSTTVNTQKPERTRIPVYSRIGFGLSQ